MAATVDDMLLSRPSPTFETSFAPATVQLTSLPSGGIRLSSPQVLGQYPARLSDMLRHWATRTSYRVFLAERMHPEGRHGRRKVTYAETFATVQAIGEPPDPEIIMAPATGSSRASTTR